MGSKLNMKKKGKNCHKNKQQKQHWAFDMWRVKPSEQWSHMVVSDVYLHSLSQFKIPTKANTSHSLSFLSPPTPVFPWSVSANSPSRDIRIKRSKCALFSFLFFLVFSYLWFCHPYHLVSQESCKYDEGTFEK